MFYERQKVAFFGETSGLQMKKLLRTALPKRKPLNSTFFELNIKALEHTQPELAAMLRDTSLDGFLAEPIQTKTSAPSVRIRFPGAEKPVLLHSAYDPMREAKRWAENLDIPNQINLIMIGTGLGYYLLTLFQSHLPKIRLLLIIERDIRILKLAFSTTDLRPVIMKKGTRWLIGYESSRLIDLISKEEWTDIIMHNCKFLTHEPSLQCYPEYYQKVQTALLETISHSEVNLRTSFENRGRNQFNLFMNLPAIFNGYLLNQFKDRFRGYPAVVVAAGPSLDKNIQQLKKINDRAGLIIVDTAQVTFLRNGLWADAVITGDPTPLNFSHFEKIESMQEAFLVFHPEVNRQITQKFVSHPYVLPLYDKDALLLTYLFDQEAQCGTMERAMNVGHLAFNFAQYLGFAPIILVGFDFAFPKEGGTTHVKDAAVSRSITAIGQDGVVEIGEKAGKAIRETGKMLLVPGYYGDLVPTTMPFLQYIRALEKTIAECPFEVIDATEGGAHFEGAIQMPLEEAISRYLQNTGVEDIWTRIKQQKKNSFSLPALLEKLQVIQQKLMECRKICESLWKMLEEWKGLYYKPVLEWEEANASWEAFDQLWVALAGDELFNTALGSSVHHLYFLRQRSSQPEENTPKALLKSLGQKYEFIIPEMTGMIDNFIQCNDLAIQALKTYTREP